MQIDHKLFRRPLRWAKKRETLIVAIAGVLAAGLWAGHWTISRPCEPVYYGKPVTYWIRRPALEDKHVGSDWEVFGQLPKMDSNALPYLRAALLAHDSRFANTYARLWRSLPRRIRSVLPAPISRTLVRMNVASAIGDMGDVGVAALPTLLNVLTNDESEEVRMLAAESVGKLGRGSNHAQAALISALGDKSVQVREAVTNALAEIVQR